MAQNNLNPIYSSDDEEETSSSETDEVSDTDSGENQQQEPKKALIPPHPQSANKPQPPDLSSSETEESGSDSDTDTDSDSDEIGAVDRIKPIAWKPMERAVGTNVETKSVKTDGSSKLRTISTSPSGKRKPAPPAPTANEQDAKKAKQNTADEEPKNAGASQSAPDLSSSEAEESSSDTDSDSDSQSVKSNVADPSIKPRSSKPMEREGANVEKDGSKSISTAPAAKSKRPPPAPMVNEKDAKKAKQKAANRAPDCDLRPEKSTVKPKDGPKTVLMLAAPHIKRTPVAPTANEKDAKKGKNAETEDDSKKQLFQRLWSEDDEVVILQGMIDYKTENNGENPIADMGAFHEFIKKSLHVEVSRSQLVDKVRRLRKKYVNNVGKEKDGKERSFSKSHEQKCYELSKLIWGSASHNSGTESKKNQSQKNGSSKGMAASLPKSNGVDDKEKSKMEVAKNNIDISQFVQYGGRNDYPVLPEEIVKAGMELVDDSRRAELEEKWKKLKEQELALYVKRMELLHEQALVVLEAINSSGN